MKKSDVVFGCILLGLRALFSLCHRAVRSVALRFLSGYRPNSCPSLAAHRLLGPKGADGRHRGSASQSPVELLLLGLVGHDVGPRKLAEYVSASRRGHSGPLAYVTTPPRCYA